MGDPFKVGNDIHNMQTAITEMKNLTDAMNEAHKALQDLDKSDNGYCPIETFVVRERRFMTKYRDNGMTKGEQHLVDGIRVFLEERIRVAYERIQVLKEKL